MRASHSLPIISNYDCRAWARSEPSITGRLRAALVHIVFIAFLGTVHCYFVPSRCCEIVPLFDTRDFFFSRRAVTLKVTLL